MPVEYGVSIEADRQVLAAVVMNLLQNAFKFSRPRTTVTLRVGAVFTVDLPRFPVPSAGRIRACAKRDSVPDIVLT